MPSIEAQLAAVDAQVDDGPPLCDVAPLGDRLVLFYADYNIVNASIVAPALHAQPVVAASEVLGAQPPLAPSSSSS